MPRARRPPTGAARLPRRKAGGAASVGPPSRDRESLQASLWLKDPLQKKALQSGNWPT
eukprot:CAMPEP_0185157236 /NCGR_PEP_ID=MMETSP1139-20130426/1645_1 /TAXON_ID=298111 /ORGANISM="Pavlova sp., Strain CCMP459" /LENGTH=57 /DNA_ID=CAMNT_0027722307 /DNA_START=57 /DNA_END=226 /DNA_ORIENTATION=+